MKALPLLFYIAICLANCTKLKTILFDCDGDEDGWQSFYTPNAGTQNIYKNYISCNMKMIGKKLDSGIIVLSDLGSFVAYFDGAGVQKWMYRYDTRFYDLQIKDNVATFLNGNYVMKYDLYSGARLNKERTQEKYRCLNDQVICTDEGVILKATKKLYSAEYPRAALVKRGVLYIADTFGFKVKAIDLKTDKLICSIDSYYPNDLELNGDELLVTEEHANRIYNLNIRTLIKTPLITCNHSLFKNLNSTVSDIQSTEKQGYLTRSDGKSVCADSLYSPNGAAKNADGTYLISDTDNHRVLHIDSHGVIIRQLINVNNPVRAYLVPAKVSKSD